MRKTYTSKQQSHTHTHDTKILQWVSRSQAWSEEVNQTTAVTRGCTSHVLQRVVYNQLRSASTLCECNAKRHMQQAHNATCSVHGQWTSMVFPLLVLLPSLMAHCGRLATARSAYHSLSVGLIPTETRALCPLTTQPPSIPPFTPTWLKGKQPNTDELLGKRHSHFPKDKGCDKNGAHHGAVAFMNLPFLNALKRMSLVRQCWPSGLHNYKASKFDPASPVPLQAVHVISIFSSKVINALTTPSQMEAEKCKIEFTINFMMPADVNDISINNSLHLGLPTQ